MPKAHRHGDYRICGATTVVQNQSTVFVNNKLWAVRDSHNSHGDGGLINTGTTVFIENKPVIVLYPDHANPDHLCPFDHHCDPETATASPNVFAFK